MPNCADLEGFLNFDFRFAPDTKNLMSTESEISFQPEWKELLHGTLEGRQFTIELTMGVLKVFLPTASKWEALAPAWAKGRWEQVRAALAAWCEKQKIPLVIEENAWVEFDKT
jgi:hypothetical protein